MIEEFNKYNEKMAALIAYYKRLQVKEREVWEFARQLAREKEYKKEADEAAAKNEHFEITNEMLIKSTDKNVAALAYHAYKMLKAIAELMREAVALGAK